MYSLIRRGLSGFKAYIMLPLVEYVFIFIPFNAEQLHDHNVLHYAILVKRYFWIGSAGLFHISLWLYPLKGGKNLFQITRISTA